MLAVDNLADAVKVVQNQYPELTAVRAAIHDALQLFTAAAPDIHDLRNLIERFEEYDQMVGRLQKSNQLPKQRWDK